MHRLLGAEVVKMFMTRDGRERIVMKYKLNPAAKSCPVIPSQALGAENANA